MSLAIHPLDPADDATIDEVLRLRDAARAVDWPDFPPPCPISFRGLLRFARHSRRDEFRVARDGDVIVGFLEISLPLLDNLENADVDIVVHPDHRRRGIGRAFHEYTLDFLRDAGRKRVGGHSLDAGPAADFARAMGAQPGLAEVRRRLDLSTMDDDVDTLAAAWSKAGGYELVQWTNRTPDRYVDDVASLDATFLTEAPIGDLVLEPERVDTARIRESEAWADLRGFRRYHTGAVHTATGRLVALSALGRPASTTWHANQWITLVNPDHRGHRLGLVVKLENLRLCRMAEPALRYVDTWNADVNDHMIAINEAMGFRVVDTWMDWQQEF